MNKVHFGKLSRTILLRELEKELRDVQNLFVTSMVNVPGNSQSDLRRKLVKNKSRLRVVKNSLGRKALESTPAFKAAARLVDGKCGLTFAKGDAAQISKIFAAFSEENPGFKICGAMIGGELFTTDQVKALATLPSREELIAKFLGALQSPISGIVTVLNQVVCGVVNVLDQIRESKNKQV